VERVDRLVVNVRNCRGCRSCQLACSFSKAGVFNPAKSMIRLERNVTTGHTAPMICPIGCDLCYGDPACIRACRYGGITSGLEPVDYKVLVRV
jgi:carbon-monoxide dehydrogenase iron sulfur subunit